MPQQINSVIEEIEIRFKRRALDEAKAAIISLDKEIEKLKSDALKLEKGSEQFGKLATEIDKLTASRTALAESIKSAPIHLLSDQEQAKIKAAQKEIDSLSDKAKKDIDINFNQRALTEAKTRLKEIDRELIQLKKDATAVGTSSANFAGITGRLGDLTKEKQQLQSIVNSGKLDLTAAGGSLLNFKNIAGSAGTALKTLGVAFGAFQVVNFIKNSVLAAAEIEKTAKAFEAFGIPAEKALSLAKQIDNLAAKVPFESEQVNASAKALLKFNVSAQDLQPTILRLSAIAKGADVSLDSLTDTFGRANKNGTVFGRDFIQLYKNVPGIVDAIAANTGKSIAQITKLGKQGKLSFEEFNKGIVAVTDSTGKYGKVIDSFQNSFEGVLKQTKEDFGDILEETGAQLLPSLKEGLKGLADIAKTLIPVFKILGEVIGSVFAATGKIFETLKEAPSKISSFIEAVKDGRVRFGGRLFTVDEREGKNAITEQVSKTVDSALSELQAKIDKKTGTLKVKTPGIDPKFTDEQKAALSEFEANFTSAIDQTIKSIESAIKGNKKITLDFKTDFGSENQRQVEREKIKQKYEDQITAITEAAANAKEAAKKAIEKQAKDAEKLSLDQGIEFDANKFKTKLNSKLAELDKSVIDATGSLEKRLQTELERFDLEVTVPVKTKVEIDQEKIADDKKELESVLKALFPDVTINLDDFINFDKGNTVERTKSSVKSIFDGILSENAKFQKDLKEQQKADADFKNGFLAKLFNFDNEEQQKAFTDALQTFASKAKEAANVFIESELSKTDFLISETEKRLDKLLSIQEGGNVDQIRLEQERLDTLNKQRSDFLQKQDALNKIQILGNNAVAISEGILAVTKAFGSEGNLFTGIATSIALAATLVATIASLTSSINSIPKFYEGTESVGSTASKMKPVFKRDKDQYIAAVHRDERIVPDKINKRIPRTVRNEDLPELVQGGIIYKTIFKSGKENSKESIPGASLDHSKIEGYSIPRISEMKVSRDITINMDTKKLEHEQRRTNDLLEKLYKKEYNNNLTVKVLSDNGEKVRLQKMAK